MRKIFCSHQNWTQDIQLNMVRCNSCGKLAWAKDIDDIFKKNYQAKPNKIMETSQTKSNTKTFLKLLRTVYLIILCLISLTLLFSAPGILADYLNNDLFLYGFFITIPMTITIVLYIFMDLLE